jgi:hypothetical protein
MFDLPDTSPWRLHALSISERAKTLRLELQALRQRSLRLSQESRQLCRERIPPQTVWIRSLRPQMSEPPPLAEAATIWVREMTRAFQLHFELDVQVHRSAEVIAAVQAMREQAPDLADWVLPDLCPRKPAPREPARPAPISRSPRPRDNKTDASERRSA